MLAHRQSLAAFDRRGDAVPRLVDERARGAVGAFGLRELLLDALARSLRPRAAAARSDVRGALIEQPPADSTGPTGVANRRKPDHADRVEAAASARLLRDREMRVLLRHEHRI